MPSSASLRPVLLRLWRLGLLALAVFLIRHAVNQREEQALAATLTAEKVRDYFPTATSLGESPNAQGWLPVESAAGTTLGYVTTTSPDSDRIVGYSGPTRCLLAFDTRGNLIGLRLLTSHDTVEHVAEVIADRSFFTQFYGKRADQLTQMPLHTVSGATLTSTAIAQGVMARLGKSAGVSLRFPEEISLAEVQKILPETQSLTPSKIHPSGRDALNGNQQRIGIAVRTSPTTDTLIGYKGPTDTLLVLDAEGKTVKGIAVRKSYDTKRYTAYVTGDSYFLNLFNGISLDKLAALDFAQAKIEGVSGATETSWSVAEGLKRRANTLLAESSAPWLPRISWRWQDTGHVIVLLSAFLMAFSPLRGRAWLRHLHHLLLIGYVGLISGEMLSQGLLAGWASHGTSSRGAPGLVLLTATALLGPVFTRRHLYCHHICPHGALQQLLARRLPWQWHPSQRLSRILESLPFVLLGVIFTIVITGLSVDLNALEPFDAWLIHVAGWASISIALVGLCFALVTPMAYCKYGCPTGALFKLLRFTGDQDRLGLRDWIAATLLTLAWLLA